MGDIASIMKAMTPGAYGIWGLVALVSLALIKGWPAMAEAALKAKTAMGDRRLSRIEKLEAKIDEQRVSYEAEIGILRHELNNVTTAFEALLLLIESKPESAAQHVSRIREMREKQAINQAAEKAAIRAARIVSAGANAKGVGE
jgi:hypothetical protein